MVHWPYNSLPFPSSGHSYPSSFSITFSSSSCFLRSKALTFSWCGAWPRCESMLVYLRVHKLSICHASKSRRHVGNARAKRARLNCYRIGNQRQHLHLCPISLIFLRKLSCRPHFLYQRPGLCGAVRCTWTLTFILTLIRPILTSVRCCEPH